jgi:hypothetical protein
MRERARRRQVRPRPAILRIDLERGLERIDGGLHVAVKLVLVADSVQEIARKRAVRFALLSPRPGVVAIRLGERDVEIAERPRVLASRRAGHGAMGVTPADQRAQPASRLRRFEPAVELIDCAIKLADRLVVVAELAGSFRAHGQPLAAALPGFARVCCWVFDCLFYRGHS